MGLARLIGREYHFVVGNYPSIFRVIWPEAVRAGSHTARAHACLSYLKFIYSEKATKFCKISTLNLSYVLTVKSTVEILQNFEAFSEYMNFNKKHHNLLWMWRISFF